MLKQGLLPNLLECQALQDPDRTCHFLLRMIGEVERDGQQRQVSSEAIYYPPAPQFTERLEGWWQQQRFLTSSNDAPWAHQASAASSSSSSPAKEATIRLPMASTAPASASAADSSGTATTPRRARRMTGRAPGWFSAPCLAASTRLCTAPKISAGQPWMPGGIPLCVHSRRGQLVSPNGEMQAEAWQQDNFQDTQTHP